MIARWLLFLMIAAAAPALAQQNVRVPVESGGRTIELAAQLYHPARARGRSRRWRCSMAAAASARTTRAWPGCSRAGAT